MDRRYDDTASSYVFFHLEYPLRLLMNMFRASIYVRDSLTLDRKDREVGEKRLKTMFGWKLFAVISW